MIEALIEELAQREQAGDLAAAVQALDANPLPPDQLANVAGHLYQRELSVLPFVITRQLVQNGFDNAVLHALLAHVALRLRQADVATASIARLTAMFADDGAQVRAQPDATQREAVRELLDPALPRDAIHAFVRGDHALNRAYMRLWGTIEPQAVARFALPSPDRAAAFDRLLMPSDETKLHDLETPPRGLQRVARKTVLGIRHRWYPDQPSSRAHDIPPRVEAAFENYGWRVLRHDLRSLRDDATVAADYRTLAAMCRETGAEVLVLDDFMPSRGADAAGDIIRALRRDVPALRIVGLYMDPWLPEQWDDIEAGADCLDAVWTFVATPVWQRPVFRGKTLLMPFSQGGLFPMAPPVQPGFRFGGGVHYVNWDRALWVAAIAEAQLPLQIAISTHADDALGPLDSYRAYMHRQGATGEAILNFARRFNGVHTVTGRAFETLATGNLLVQERSDDIDGFLVAGKHYLRFETMTDLHDIAHLIRTAPDIVETIRQEGAAFFRARYTDERLVACLDHLLFHAAAKRAAA